MKKYGIDCRGRGCQVVGDLDDLGGIMPTHCPICGHPLHHGSFGVVEFETDAERDEAAVLAVLAAMAEARIEAEAKPPAVNRALSDETEAASRAALAEQLNSLSSS